MSDTSRRAFLRGGLRAALAGTAGGLLLPWQGGSALALPDLANAADIPVTTGPLPVSRELLKLRRIIAKQHEVHRTQHDRSLSHDERNRQFAALRHAYTETAEIILDRPATTWGQVAEIAEIAWTEFPKEWILPTDWEGRDDLESVLALEIGTHRYAGIHHPFALKAMARLVEAVLALSGGARRDYHVAGDVPIIQPSTRLVDAALKQAKADLHIRAGR